MFDKIEKHQGKILLFVGIVVVLIFVVVLFRKDSDKDGYTNSSVLGFNYSKKKIDDKTKSLSTGLTEPK